MNSLTSVIAGGLIAILSNVALQWTKQHDERRKQDREDHRAANAQKIASDATCWRLVKHHLDEFWWETEGIAPGIHGTTAIPFVRPVNIRWVEHWNAIAKISRTFALHDVNAQRTLDKLRIVARGMSVSAGMAQYSRQNLADPKTIMELSAEANKALVEFRQLYKQVNETIRDTVRFDVVYEAPLIDVKDLPLENVPQPEIDDYIF